MKKFSATIESDRRSYAFQIKLPFTYGDGIMRVYIYKYDSWPGWKYTVNAHCSADFYPTAEAAAEGALVAIDQIITELRSITVRDLVGDTTGDVT